MLALISQFVSLFPFSNMTESPIFILSCNRSGSTLLRYILDTHPDIASPAELNLGQICSLLYLANLATLGNTNLHQKYSLSVETFILQEIRETIAKMMEKYTWAKGKSLWCEKSPQNLLYLPTIKAVFPNAKYICLYRHGMDVIHSCLEASRWSFMPDQLDYVCQNSGSIVGAMAQNWIEKTRTSWQFEAENSEQCFHIKYEDCVVNPLATLKPMFEFLGVAWQPELIDRIFTTQHDLGAQDIKSSFSKKINKNTIGKGTKISPRYIPQHHLEAMNELLNKLDYPTVDSSWGTAIWPGEGLSKKERDSDRPQTLSTEEAVNSLLRSWRLRLPELAEHLKGRSVTYRVEVTGENNSYWLLDLMGKEPNILPGEESNQIQADCTVTFANCHIPEILAGEINPIEMVMAGTLQIVGDAELAEIFCWFISDRLQQRQASSSWWLQDYFGNF